MIRDGDSCGDRIGTMVWAVSRTAAMEARSNSHEGREGQTLASLGYRAFLSAPLARPRRPKRRRRLRSGSLDQPDDDQQDDRADKGVDDRGDKAATDGDADLRQQPTGDECADDADDDVADQSEAAAFHDHAGQPAGNRADDEPNDEGLYVHDFPLFPVPAGPGWTLLAIMTLNRRRMGVTSARRRPGRLCPSSNHCTTTSSAADWIEYRRG